MAHRVHRISEGWLGTDLPGLREPGELGTYLSFPLDSLPPVEGPFEGTLGWLPPLDPALDEEMAQYRPAADERARVSERLRSILTEAEEMGLEPPPAFARLMGSPELQDRFPSVTACYFDLPASMLPAPVPGGGWLVRFMNDQQGCLFWYLWLRPDGEAPVLCSDVLLDEPGEESGDGEPEVLWCAPSYEAFLYRYWLESCLWLALRDGRPLTGEQERYARFYRSRR